MTVSVPSVPVFEGVRAVELAQFVFVPACGALLADWGADVIKIEHPVSGDGYRGLVSQGILRLSSSGVNQSMEMHNRGKRGIGLDVSSAEGRQVLLRLVESAEVFLTNFLPSTFSLLATAVWTLASDMLSALQGNWAESPVAGQSTRMAPNPLVNTYATQDARFVSLMLLQPDRHWRNLAHALGREDLLEDPRFADGRSVLKHSVELVDILQPLFASRTLEEWRAAFLGHHFSWAPYAQLPEVIEDPQVLANGYIVEVEHDAGNFRLPTGAVQFDEQPAAIRRGPEQGEHTETLLLELGLDWNEIIELKKHGVIN